jgi:acetate kinase
MRRAVATFNTGSSSLKIALYEVESGALKSCLLRCNLKNPSGDLSLDIAPGGITTQTEIEHLIAGLDPAPAKLLPALVEYFATQVHNLELIAVGHRIVHGGRSHTAPCPSTPKVLEALKSLNTFAPDHQPHNLAGVEALHVSHPSLFQTLSFDTCFHRSIPETSQLYAIPKELTDQGLLRFGFHGLSYASIAERAPTLLEGRAHSKLIAAHLGSGASLCAIRNGKSTATTMGLTALSGIPMAKRCGDIDPGLILHLMAERGLSHEDVSDMLYHQSGMLGLSGISSDTRVLLNDKRSAAKQAINHYVERIAREIGALIVALEGLEAIVFTGGVGENAAEIRRRICQKLHYLGLQLDQPQNLAGGPIISAKTSRVIVAVLAADEEQIIARDALACWTAAHHPS